MRRVAGERKLDHCDTQSQAGLALLTIMLLMVIMTVLGIAAVTVTSLENRMAGYGMTGQVGTSAAESCLSTGVQVIQQVISAAPAAGSASGQRNTAGPCSIGKRCHLAIRDHGAVE